MKRIDEVFIGIFLSNCVGLLLPATLTSLNIPTGIIMFVGYLLVRFAGILLEKGYQELVKKFAADVKIEIDDDISA